MHDLSMNVVNVIFDLTIKVTYVVTIEDDLLPAAPISTLAIKKRFQMLFKGSCRIHH